jgi:hypothetical protein
MQGCASTVFQTVAPWKKKHCFWRSQLQDAGKNAAGMLRKCGSYFREIPEWLHPLDSIGDYSVSAKAESAKMTSVYDTRGLRWPLFLHCLVEAGI